MTASTGKAAGAATHGRAILTICAGIFFLVVNDALAKWLMAHYSPIQLVFIRNLLALPMIAAVAIAIGGPRILRTRHLRLHALRGVMLVLGAFTFFSGLQMLPLAEATSLVFAAPIMVTALSVPFLGEKVGWRRWSAVLVGFAGVLIVVRPGAETFQAASLLPIATAALYAVMMISARWINREEGMWTLMFYVVLFPLVFSALVVAPGWQPLDPGHLPLLVGMAVCGTLGMTLITQAFRMAPAAVVAPFDYTALVWASLIGWLVWSELPGAWTYAGATVIIASGIYIVYRETRVPRAE